MQMTIENGTLSAQRAGRTVQIQHISEVDKYRALCAFGVRSAVAAAVVKGLVTINVTAA